MPTRRHALIAVAIAALALAAAPLSVGAATTAPPAGPAVLPDDMSMGSPTAKIQVIEYASLACPHCGHFNETIFPALKAKYIDTGKVSYTLKEYLTEPEVLAAGGFLLARCAGKDRYFPVLNAVFRAQNEMVQTGAYRDVLSRIAKAEGGMSADAFTACMRDKPAQQALSARVTRHLQVDKIEAVPTFVINGTRFEGEMTLPELDQAIAKAAG